MASADSLGVNTSSRQYPDKLTSLVATKGIWDTRKISVWGVARSVISQLKSGQDLTRVSLPSIFLSPFSMLELAADRYLAHLSQLQDINADSKPIDRMIVVIRWFLAAFADLEFEKKPYNPVLGETHQCSAKIGSGKNASEVTFVGEQVLHHPPVTAFAIHHPSARVSIEGNVSFGVKFHGNSVSCDTKGFSLLNWDNKEHYRITKGLPDVMISNVIIGTRAMSWSGTVEITCEETGYTAKLLFKRKKQNCVVGEIFYKNYRSGEQPLYVFEGCWSEEAITAQPAEDGMAPILVFDNADAKKLDIDYFATEKLPETDSLKVWYDVSKAIAEDDLQRADAAKTTVEGAQRTRVKEGAEDLANPRKFFEVDSEGIWRWNGGMYHDKVVKVLDHEDVSVSESVDDTGSEHQSRKSSSAKKSNGGNKKAHGKNGKKLNRQLSATNTSASMSTSTDFSAVSETDFE